MYEIVNAYIKTSAFTPSVSLTHAGECERSVNVISVWATVNTEICWSKHRLPIPDVTRTELKEQKINKVGVSLLRRRSEDFVRRSEAKSQEYLRGRRQSFRTTSDVTDTELPGVLFAAVEAPEVDEGTELLGTVSTGLEAVYLVIIKRNFCDLWPHLFIQE